MLRAERPRKSASTGPCSRCSSPRCPLRGDRFFAGPGGDINVIRCLWRGRPGFGGGCRSACRGRASFAVLVHRPALMAVPEPCRGLPARRPAGVIHAIGLYPVFRQSLEGNAKTGKQLAPGCSSWPCGRLRLRYWPLCQALGLRVQAPIPDSQQVTGDHAQNTTETPGLVALRPARRIGKHPASAEALLSLPAPSTPRAASMEDSTVCDADPLEKEAVIR